MSVDIDFFTDTDYRSVNFDIIQKKLLEHFPIVETSFSGNRTLGKSFYIGQNAEGLIKTDLFYCDKFVFPAVHHKKIKIASLEEIAAMKLEVIGNQGRKKDFWDIHELLNRFSLKDMLGFYTKRNPYGYKKEELIYKLTDFSLADEDFDPLCHRGKYWELIKLDIEEKVNSL